MMTLDDACVCAKPHYSGMVRLGNRVCRLCNKAMVCELCVTQLRQRAEDVDDAEFWVGRTKMKSSRARIRQRVGG